jgi:membrane protease YdiL (CAAX protease family)
VETDPLKKSLLRGEIADPSPSLPEGFRLLAQFRRQPSPTLRESLETLGYLGLTRLNQCFAAFSSIFILSFGLVLYESPKPETFHEPAPSTPRLLTIFFAWGVANRGLAILFANLPRLVLEPAAFALLWYTLSGVTLLSLLRWGWQKPLTKVLPSLYRRFHLGWVARGYLLCLVLVTALEATTLWLGGEVPISLGFLKSLHAAQGFSKVILVSVAVLVAPILEETAFRGCLMRALMKWKGPVPAVILSAVMFSLWHGNPAALPSGFALGCCLGWVYLRSGSVGAAVAVHGLWNATSLIHAYAALP